MDESERESIEIYCPQCNVQVQAEVVARHIRSVPQAHANPADLADTPHDVSVFSVAECRRCLSVFLAQRDFYEIPGEVSAPQTDWIILYPKARSFDESLLPPTAAGPYKNGATAYQVGLYEPCVIMCRKCLEAICLENGITKGNLKARLDKLHSQGIIDAKLLTWATGLRLVANDAAHEMGVNISMEDARDSLEFIEALFLYVFSLDRRFQEFQKRRKASKDVKRVPKESK